MKILVIEDDKKIAEFIARGLEQEKYEVDVVHDGDAGYQRVLDGTYGLVILDVMLPKKDGVTLVRDLRERMILIPVIMLSAKNTEEDIVAGLNAGADDYLKKPFAFTEFLARVKALHRRSEQERGAKIHFADLCIDPVLHKVWRDEVVLDLTAKEYELLEFFVRHPNQILTRSMIADEVWQGAFDKLTNIIDVYINYLRKKIDWGKDKKLIHTVRGIGYILKEEE
jgi:DNA-binding response OmpR family regulator